MSSVGPLRESGDSFTARHGRPSTREEAYSSPAVPRRAYPRRVTAPVVGWTMQEAWLFAELGRRALVATLDGGSLVRRRLLRVQDAPGGPG